MKIAGDAFSVFEQRHLAEPLMQAGIVDGDTGSRSERRQQALVLLAELVGRALLGQVEVAEDESADSDGDARGTNAWADGRAGKPEKLRVGDEIRQAQRMRLLDEQTEHAAGRLGRSPIRDPRSAAERPQVMNSTSSVAARVEHPERPERRIGERAGRRHDPFQHAVEVEVRGDRKIASSRPDCSNRTGSPRTSDATHAVPA